MYNPYPNYNFIHSCYVYGSNNATNTDAIVAMVKNVDTLESKLHIVPNPMVRVWVAKKGLRRYTYKRECAKLSELDTYICQYKQLGNTLAKALDPNYYGYANTRKLMESPYVYGADIAPEIQMKLEYIQASSKAITSYDIGVMDIETSVLGDNQIILNGYCDWKTRHIYCWILKEWYTPSEHWEEDLLKRWRLELDNIYSQLNDKAKQVFIPSEWTPEFIMCDNEKELIERSIRTVVKCKPDFCCCWNIPYEMTWIPQRAQFRGIDVADLFSHPDVPEQFRMFKFKEDTRRVEHLADKWHTVQCPGYTYWVDPMCLYGRLRKVKGREVMYTLDYICGKNLGAGKMKFGSNQTHYLMQTNDKTGYAVYNCFDVLQPNILDHVTTDISSMIMLTGPSLLDDFAHQTVQLKAQFYEYCLSKGAVPGTVSGSMRKEYDDLISNVGGAVLNPCLMRYEGSRCLKESDDPTDLYRLCCDLDVTSFYPSLTIAMNISRETKKATVLWMTGCPYTIDELRNRIAEIRESTGTERTREERKYFDVIVKANADYIFGFFSRYPSVLENAVSLCHQYFHLPSYDEMLELFLKDTDITTVKVPDAKIPF